MNINEQAFIPAIAKGEIPNLGEKREFSDPSCFLKIFYHAPSQLRVVEWIKPKLKR